AYEMVQRVAMQTWAAKHAGRNDADFLTQLKNDADIARHLPAAEIDKICSIKFHLRHVKNRFRKVGL
ncbi:MAG: adenylosuccinate lyase, partial [Verrucomicrobiae bacterium]|nr:adenylosuccinate lyase [Verrucomicrobiae bacterium]